MTQLETMLAKWNKEIERDYVRDPGEMIGLGDKIINLLQAKLKDRRELALRPEITDVYCELNRAMELHPSMNSAHEGYAVILEELDELKQHVWLKESKRDIQAMREEATHVAAMAIRFMIDICGDLHV